jgi:ABC-2 type transport system ATP-binding protein
MFMLLNVENLSHRYGKHLVLNQISLQVNKGEIFGLIGLNGAGKTTMIKSILHLVTGYEGAISVDGLPNASVEARGRLAYLPEKFQPSRNLKGYEHLTLSLKFYGMKLDREAAQREAEALDLDPARLDSRIATYSKGMGQKLGLITNFLLETPLLILDEPMSGLDPKARIRLKQRLMKAREQGRTMFISSHILADMDEICDRVAVLNGGKLVFTGKPAALRAQYDNINLEQAFLRAIEPAAA